jgi:hypothetical protein
MLRERLSFALTCLLVPAVVGAPRVQSKLAPPTHADFGQFESLAPQPRGGLSPEPARRSYSLAPSRSSR